MCFRMKKEKRRVCVDAFSNCIGIVTSAYFFGLDKGAIL